MLEDIERIEVIRGPGAVTWGANAVNGVINIVTRSSHDTLGSLATSSFSDDFWIAAARHGGHLGEEATYRIFFKSFDRDPLERK